MNRTITSLSLNNIYSGLFFSSYSFSNHFLTIKRVNFRYSFGNLLFFDKIPNLLINDAGFHCIIGKAIKIGTLSYNLVDYIEQVMTFSDSVVSLSNCRFIRCKGSNSSPVIVQNSVTSFILTRTIFDGCSSLTGSGGGINVKSKECLFNSICFNNCFANSSSPLSWGGASQISGTTLNVSFVSVNDISSRDGALQINSPTTNIGNFNCSNSRTHEASCGLQFASTQKLEVNYMVFYKDYANHMIGFWGSGNQINANYMSVVKCTLFQTTGYIGYIRSMITATAYISNILIIESSVSPIASGTGPISVSNSNITNSATYYLFSFLNTYKCQHFPIIIQSPLIYQLNTFWIKLFYMSILS